MATKNAKATKATKGVVKGVATKATKGKAKVTPKVTKSNEVVLDAKSDITAVADGMVECSACKTELEQTSANFSPMAKGGFRSICKPCQTKASLAWTTKRADYRKVYQRAIQLINLGIPAIVPNAKDWKEGDVLMTVEYVDKQGNTVKSQKAEMVYAKMKKAQADARASLKAERDAVNAELKAQRQMARAEAKEARETAKAEVKAQRQAERAELKATRDAERAEKAELAKTERAEKAQARAIERAEKSAEKAELKRIEREQKAIERAEASKQKAIEKAQAVADKAQARQEAAVLKALSATA